jgi:hypothetical protein
MEKSSNLFVPINSSDSNIETGLLPSIEALFQCLKPLSIFIVVRFVEIS